MGLMYFLLTIIYQIIYVRGDLILKSITIYPSGPVNWSLVSTATPTKALHQAGQSTGFVETSPTYSMFTEAPQQQQLLSSSIQTSENRSQSRSDFEIYYIRTSVSLSTNASAYSTVRPSPCYDCNERKGSALQDKEFSYIMLGAGIGSAIFIFAMSLFVVVCKKVQEKRQNRGENSIESVRDSNDILRSKDSIFTSSTLQLHDGLHNDGLELDTFPSPCFPDGAPKPSSAHHHDNSERLDSLHVNIDTNVSAIPSSESRSVCSLESELEFSASIKLLQNWNDALEDHDSDQFKELKLEVEESVKDVYGKIEEFRGVKVSAFREGSIIVDMVLIMLAVVQDPLHILEKSVRTGKLGKLNIDNRYLLKGRSKSGNAASYVDMTQELQFGATVREQIVEEYHLKTEMNELNDAYVELPFDYEVIPEDNYLQKGPIYSNMDVLDTGEESYIPSNDRRKQKVSLDGLLDENSGLLERQLGLKERQHSLADLRGLSTAAEFREQRDSGIGSMQELTSSEIRLSRTTERCEEGEKVFYDIPESLDVPPCDSEGEYYNSAQILDQIDEDVPHVAVYNFQAENDQELSIKQGDIVHVTSRNLGGWMKVVNAEEQVGWVPESFLVHVSRSQLSDTQETVETLKFLDNILEQIDNESGSSSSAATSPDDDECDESTKKGLAIAIEAEAEGVNLDLKKVEHKIKIQVKRCKSVYRFDGKDSSELSFKVGEIIEVHKVSEVGWWKGNLNDNSGWFPSSYVMPLNEESEIAISSKKSDFNRSVSDRFRQSDRALCLRSESDIRGKRNLKHRHKYQSLQRAARKKEEYAHLYFQILKRESKSDENIPGLFKSASLNVINNMHVLAPDWPTRAPPAPPKEDLMESSIRQHSPSYSEPPNRPVPHPPSSKPSFTKIDVMKRIVASDIVPPSRTRHENFVSMQTQYRDRSYLEESLTTVSANSRNETNT